MSPRSPILRTLILAWWLAWTILIVPGHTRGSIPLNPCPACPSASTPLFFSSLPACCKPTPANSQSNPPARSSTNCAICHIAAHTTTPTLPTPIDPALELLHIMPLVATHPTPAAAPFHPYLSRAPPTA